MSLIDIQQIAESAQMIVNGYAFTFIEGGNIRILNLHGLHHAAVIRPNGELLETNMDDIELAIVNEYWERNKKYMEGKSHA